MSRFFDVKFANPKVPLPMSVRVIEEVGSHQLAVISFSARFAHKYLFESDPTTILWGARNQVALPTYINNLDSVSTEVTETLAYCVGPTRVLKSGQQNSWQNATLSRVARDVTSRVRLRAEVDEDGRVFRSFQQPGNISAWQFLRDQADRAGLLLNTDNGVVYMKYGRELRPSAQTPVLRPLGDSYRRVFRAEIVRGQASAKGGMQAARAGFGVTDSGEVVGSYRRESTFQEFVTFPAHSIRDRQELSHDLSRDYRKNVQTQYAEIDVEGSTLFRPLNHVYLAGYDSQLDGYWMITKADHMLSDIKHSTKLELQRAGDEPKGPPSSIPRATAVRPRLRLMGSRWVSI